MTHAFVVGPAPGCNHAGPKCGKTSPGPHVDDHDAERDSLKSQVQEMQNTGMAGLAMRLAIALSRIGSLGYHGTDDLWRCVCYGMPSIHGSVCVEARAALSAAREKGLIP